MSMMTIGAGEAQIIVTTISKSIGTRDAQSGEEARVNNDGYSIEIFDYGVEIDNVMWGEGDKILIKGTETNFVSYIVGNIIHLQNKSSFAGDPAQWYLSRAYSTITLWEADTDNNLISSNEIQKGICYNDSTNGFVEDVILGRATTDELRYRILTVATGHRHLGIKTQGAFVNGTFIITEPYFVVEHLRFTHPNANSAGDTIINCSGSNVAKFNTINSVLIHDWNCTGDNISLVGINLNQNGGCKVLNTIIMDLFKNNTEADESSMAGILSMTAVSSNYIYNCTILNLSSKATYIYSYGCFGVNDNKTIVKNCIGMFREYTSSESSIPNIGVSLTEPTNRKFDFSSYVNLESGYNAQQGGGYYLKDYMPDLWKNRATANYWGSISCSNNGQYVIANCASGVSFSEDFGETWNSFNISATAGFSTGNIVSTSISRDMTLVDGVSAYTLVALGSQRIFISNNKGASWYVSSGSNGIPITGSFHHSSISDNGRVVLVLSLTDSPILKSEDYGKTFTPLSATWSGSSYTPNGDSLRTSEQNTPLSRQWKSVETSEDGEYILATVGGIANTMGNYMPFASQSRGGRFWVGVRDVNGYYTFREILSTIDGSIGKSDFRGCDISRNGKYMIVSCNTGNALASAPPYNHLSNGIHSQSQVYFSDDYGGSWKNLQADNRVFDVLHSYSAISVSAHPRSGGIGDFAFPASGSPIIRVKTATPHRLYNDDIVKIAGHIGQANTNGVFKVTPIDPYTLELYTTYLDYRVPVTPNPTSSPTSGFGGVLTTQGRWYDVSLSDDGKTMLASNGNVGTIRSLSEKGFLWQSDDYGQTWYDNHDYMTKKNYQDTAMSQDANYTFSTVSVPYDDAPDFIKVRKKTNIWTTAENTFVSPGPLSDYGNSFVGYGFRAKDINFDGVYERGYGFHNSNQYIYTPQKEESGIITFTDVYVFEMVAGYEYIDSDTFGVLTQLIPTSQVGGAGGETRFTPDTESYKLSGSFAYNYNGTFDFIEGDSLLSSMIKMENKHIQFDSTVISNWSTNPVLPTGGSYQRHFTYPELVGSSENNDNLVAGPGILCIGQKKNASFKYAITNREHPYVFDLRIKNKSPIISAGTIISGIPELLYDITGNERSSTVSWDIGAMNWIHSENSNIIPIIEYYRFITTV